MELNTERMCHKDFYKVENESVHNKICKQTHVRFDAGLQDRKENTDGLSGLSSSLESSHAICWKVTGNLMSRLGSR